MKRTEQVDTSDDTRLLLKYVAGRDFPCPACRYNLRDLTAPRCPECGSELRLQVGTTTPRFGLLLLLLTPLLMMVGIGVVFGLVALTEGLPKGWGFYVIQSAVVLDAVGVVVIYRIRRLFFRCGRIKQILLALLSWLVHASILVISIMFGV